MDVIDEASAVVEHNTAEHIKKVRLRLGAKQASKRFCKKCADEIPIERQKAVGGCEYCVDCQNEIERGM